MRSSSSLIAIVIALAACGNDRAYDCETSALTYETFGEPFMTSWCRGCHSAELYPTMRQDAPLDVNLDTLDEVRARKQKIRELTVVGDSMPPRGGPSDEERALLDAWLTCGAR